MLGVAIGRAIDRIENILSPTAAARIVRDGRLSSGSGDMEDPRLQGEPEVLLEGAAEVVLPLWLP